MPRVRFGRPNSTVGGPRKMSHRLAGARPGSRRPAGRGAAFEQVPGTVRACSAEPRGRVQAGPSLYRGVLQLPVKIPQGFLLRTCLARHRVPRSTARALHCTKGPRGCQQFTIPSPRSRVQRREQQRPRGPAAERREQQGTRQTRLRRERSRMEQTRRWWRRRGRVVLQLLGRSAEEPVGQSLLKSGNPDV